MGAPYVHQLRVRYLECDPQGVVGHPRYLGYFDVAMTEMWRQAIGPWGETVAGGADCVVAESTLRYLAPARFDDVLDIAVAVRRLGNTSMVLGFEARRGEDLLVSAENRYVFVRAGTHEKTPIPDEVREALAPFAEAAA